MRNLTPNPDANVEISIIKDQLNGFKARSTPASSSEKLPLHAATPSIENLMKATLPSDFDLDEISPASENDTTTTPKASVSSKPLMPTSYVSRPFVHLNKSGSVTPLRSSSNANVLRSSALGSSSSPSTASPRSLMKPPASRTASSISITTSSAGSVAKNKGVQMVSEMRARVKVLEQKIHTRVPRLRMASISRSSFTPSVGPMTPITGPSSSSSPASNASTAKTSLDSRKSIDSRRSNESGSDKHSKKDNGDSSGWVLIMEDSPSPQKAAEAKRLKEKRRVSVPAPTAFRPSASAVNRATSPSLSTGPMTTMAASTGLRRPQSRMSGGGASSSITSRPQTPTFLPLPSSSLYGANSSTIGMKRSTGPGASNPYNQFKRSSIGKSSAVPVPPLPTTLRDRPTNVSPIQRPTSSGSSSPSERGKALPATPDDLRANVTIRPNSRAPPSASTAPGMSLLSKSRIGRPSAGRRSGGIVESASVLDLSDLQPREPSGS